MYTRKAFSPHYIKRIFQELYLSYIRYNNLFTVHFKEGFYVNDRVRERIHECGVAPEIRMETGQLHTIKSMVLHGGCGAFLLQEAVRLDESIRAIPLDPPLEAEIGLITRKGKVIYEDAKTLIRFVKEELQEKLTENNGFL